MKIRITKFILVLFFCPILIPNAFAANQLGSSCSKIGSKIVINSKNAICSKSGKKSVWKLVNEVGLIEKNSQIPISIDNLDINGVSAKANKNVIDLLKARPKSELSPIIYSSPQITKFSKDEEVAALGRAIDFWSPYFKPSQFQVLYVTKGDEDWLAKKEGELGLQSMLPSNETWKSLISRYSPCSFGVAGTANEIPTFIQCKGTEYAGYHIQTGPHEYTHLFQRSYAGYNMYKTSWYVEGSATFFGWTLGFYPADKNLLWRNSTVANYFWQSGLDVRNDVLSKDVLRFKDRMKKLEVQNTMDTAAASYYLGSLATEVMVAIYGFDKFLELTKKIKDQDFGIAFKDTYGLSTDEFYGKLAPYVWSQIPKI